MKSLIVVLVLALLVTGCSSAPAPTAEPTVPPAPAISNTPTAAAVGLPNPASANCGAKGGRLDIRTDAGGGQVGVCVFPDGSECEEWALYRNECQPKSPVIAAPTPVVTVLAPIVIIPATTPQSDEAPGIANPASTNCVARGGTVDIRKDSAGGEVGYCKFPDGSECEEWALLRGECQPGGALPALPQPEPQVNPIEFQPGATSAMLEDSVAAGASMRYSIHALAGQTLSINLTAVQGSAVLQILGGDGTVLLPSQVGITSWSGVLPGTQDYYIDVRSVTNIVTDYWLQVTIPPL